MRLPSRDLLRHSGWTQATDIFIRRRNQPPAHSVAGGLVVVLRCTKKHGISSAARSRCRRSRTPTTELVNHLQDARLAVRALPATTAIRAEFRAAALALSDVCSYVLTLRAWTHGIHSPPPNQQRQNCRDDGAANPSDPRTDQASSFCPPTQNSSRRSTPSLSTIWFCAHHQAS
jgi:hypothetical protein